MKGKLTVHITLKRHPPILASAAGFAARKSTMPDDCGSFNNPQLRFSFGMMFAMISSDFQGRTL
jgi:hypothetical protein